MTRAHEGVAPWRVAMIARADGVPNIRRYVPHPIHPGAHSGITHPRTKVGSASVATFGLIPPRWPFASSPLLARCGAATREPRALRDVGPRSRDAIAPVFLSVNQQYGTASRFHPLYRLLRSPAYWRTTTAASVTLHSSRSRLPLRPSGDRSCVVHAPGESWWLSSDRRTERYRDVHCERRGRERRSLAPPRSAVELCTSTRSHSSVGMSRARE